MIARCYRPNNPAYERYGGRGIRVCERWLDFHLFAEDMGDGILADLFVYLSRIDDDKDYSPENCLLVGRVKKKRNEKRPLRVQTCWNNMIARCHRPTHPAYKNYGARGIKVCERWRHYDLFAEDMGVALLADPQLTLDRIDNNKGYNPENCRLASWELQARNRRGAINPYTRRVIFWCLKYKMKQIHIATLLGVDQSSICYLKKKYYNDFLNGGQSPNRVDVSNKVLEPVRLALHTERRK